MSPREAWYMARAIAGSSSAKTACGTLPARVGIAETTSRSRWMGRKRRRQGAPGKTRTAHDSAVRVGGSAPHPFEAALAKPAQEALPAGVGLGVDAGEADHPADSVLADGDGDGGGHRGGGAVAAAPWPPRLHGA